MNIGYTSLIFFLVFCEYCILITWSAGNEDDQDRRLAKKGKSPWGKFVRVERSEIPEREPREDKREVALEDSPTRAESSLTGDEEMLINQISDGSSRRHTNWTNEQKDDLLRWFYTYEIKGKKRMNGLPRDWEKINASWYAKYGHIEERKLRMQTYFLRGRMHDAGQRFDVENNMTGVVNWTGFVNDLLIKIYLATEKEYESEHGERMYAEWVRKKYPGYHIVTPEYLLKRAKTMLKEAGKLSPKSQKIAKIERKMQRSETLDFLAGGYPNWKPKHDKYLHWLWGQEGEKEGRVERIHQRALERFSEFKPLPVSQVYDRAKYVWKREQNRQLEKIANEGTKQETHLPTFKDNYLFESMSPIRTYHYHEWIAGPSFTPRPSHQQHDSESDSETPKTGGQSPDTNLKLR